MRGGERDVRRQERWRRRRARLRRPRPRGKRALHLPPVRIQRTPPEGHTLREQELPQVRDTHGGSTLLKRIARRCAGNRGTRQDKVEESREKNPVRRR